MYLISTSKIKLPCWSFKRFVFLLSLVFGLFLAVSVSAAPSQTLINYYQSNNNSSEYLGQTLGVGDGTYLNQIKIWASASSTKNFAVYFREGTSSVNSLGCNGYPEKNMFFGSSSVNGGPTEFIFSTTSPVYLDPTKYYGIEIVGLEGGDRGAMFGIWNGTDIYTAGELTDCGYGTLPAGHNDLSFVFNGTDATSDTLFMFTVPSNGYTARDFSNWQFRNTNSLTPLGMLDCSSYPDCPVGSVLKVSVRYATSSNLSNPYVDTGVMQNLVTLGSSSQLVFGATGLLPKSQILSDGSWFAQATLFWQSSTSTGSLDVTSVINFGISSSSGQQFTDFIQQGFDSGNAHQFNCQEMNLVVAASTGNLSCWISKTILGIADSLFRPNQFSLNTLSGAMSGFKDVFPFSVFFQFETYAYAASTNVSSSAASITMNMPAGTPWENTHITLLSSSSLSFLIGQQNKDDLFNFMGNFSHAVALFIAIFTVI